MNNYVYGRYGEISRLSSLRGKGIAIIGGRFRGSKISKGWIRSLGFNPYIDLWYVTKEWHIHFEQIKTAHKGHKAKISNKEIEGLQRFADIFRNSNTVWVGYVLKEYRKAPRVVRLN